MPAGNPAGHDLTPRHDDPKQRGRMAAGWDESVAARYNAQTATAADAAEPFAEALHADIVHQNREQRQSLRYDKPPPTATPKD
jgi:hypothetical protein